MPMVMMVAVGLGCTDEKPTAQTEELNVTSEEVLRRPCHDLCMYVESVCSRTNHTLTFCDAVDVLIAHGIDFQDCRPTGEISKYLSGCSFGEECVMTKAEEALAQWGWPKGLLEKFQTQLDSAHLADLKKMDVPTVVVLCRTEMMNSAIEAELESLNLSEKRGSETVYRCGTPDNWDELVQLEAVLVTTPSWCNMKVFDEDRQPQLEDASEATRAKIGSLGRLPTSP